MKQQINEKLNIKPNWDSILKYSGVVTITLFAIALIFKIRTLIVVAELFMGILIFSLILVAAYAALNKYSSKDKE